jgi:hypothetical protein
MNDMPRDRLIFRLVLALGLAAVFAFHSSGVLSHADAHAAATLGEGPVWARVLGLGVDLLRLVYAPLGLFHAAHLAAGFLLAAAAALSAVVAARSLGGRPGADLAAAFFAGAAVLFGGDVGRAGLETGPTPVVLALLSGCAAAWTAAPARALTGGLCLGAAVAAHPLSLAVVPGLAWLAPRNGRAAAGALFGLALLALPGAAAAWRSVAADASADFAGFGAVLWRSAGPVGVLALLAVVALRPGGFALLRTFLVAFAGAAATWFLVRTDAGLKSALVAWPLLFCAAPGLAAAGRWIAPGRLPALGLVAAGALLGMNWGAVNRSAERGTGWAEDSLLSLPADALLLTSNPVHDALVRDGFTAAGEVLFQEAPDAPAFRRRVQEAGDRHVYIDASIFFDPLRRDAILGGDLHAVPHGLILRLLPTSEAAPTKAPLAWEHSEPGVASLPSPLRDGLTVAQFYGRSLVQSGYRNLEEGLDDQAERDFVLAYSLGEPNPTLAAMGLARVFLERRNAISAIGALEGRIRAEDDGAWNAFQLLGSAYARSGRERDAIAALAQALPLVPATMPSEKEQIRQTMEQLERRLAQRGPRG